MPASFKNQNTGGASKIEKFEPPIRHTAKKVVIPGDDMSDMFKKSKTPKEPLNIQKTEASGISTITPQVKTVKRRIKKKKPNAQLAIVPKQISPELAVMLDYLTDYVTLDDLPNNQELTFNQVITSLVENKLKSLSEFKANDYRSTVTKAIDKIPNNLSDSEMRSYVKDKKYKK